MASGNHSDRGSVRHIIPAGSHAVRLATEAAREFADMAAIPRDCAARLAIVVEELVANLVEHALLSEAARIVLEMARNGNDVRITLEDGGEPFDPRRAPMPAGLPPAKGGGAGLAIIRAWSQVESYGRVGGNNRLVLTMALPGG